jgi:simple sugar transport system permease protein
MHERPRLLRGGWKAALGLAVGFAVAALVASAFSRDPWRVFLSFAIGPFRSSFALSVALLRTAPLAITAMGAALCFRMGSFTLGMEGQVYAGAVIASATAGALIASLRLPPLLAIAVSACAAALSGASLSGLSALLKSAFGASVMITSFFIMQITIAFFDWCVNGPLRDRSTDLLSTQAVPGIGPASPVLAFSFSAGIAVAAWVFLRANRRGFEARLYGSNPQFASALGISTSGSDAFALAVSGALSGLAGFMLAFSNEGRAIKGISGGMGWDAIGVALLAGLSPTASLAVAFAYAWLDSASRAAAVYGGLAVSVAAIAKAILLAIAAKGAASGGDR